MVQCVRLGLSVPGPQVRSLIRDQRFHMPHPLDQNSKLQKNRSNIVTKSIKDFKNGPHQKKSLKKINPVINHSGKEHEKECMYVCNRITLLYSKNQHNTSLVAQIVKNLPATQEPWVQFLAQEDPLEEGMETHSSFLAWRIPWTEEAGRLQSIGLHRVRHNRRALAHNVNPLYFN